LQNGLREKAKLGKVASQKEDYNWGEQKNSFQSSLFVINDEEEVDYHHLKVDQHCLPINSDRVLFVDVIGHSRSLSYFLQNDCFK